MKPTCVELSLRFLISEAGDDRRATKIRQIETPVDT